MYKGFDGSILKRSQVYSLGEIQAAYRKIMGNLPLTTKENQLAECIREATKTYVETEYERDITPV